MFRKERGKRAIVLASAAMLVAAFAAPSVARSAPAYPDLRTEPLFNIQLSTALVGAEHHYLVRFSNTVSNVGTGPFELHGSPHFPLDGLFDATQWVYDSAGGLEMDSVGTFAYHPSHNHFHFNGFARYELWTKRAYDRAAASGFSTGTAQYVSPKVSFCIYDYGNPHPENGPPAPVYNTCSPAMEGISVGWADTYESYLPEQWVDVGLRPLVDGDYVLRSIADPDNLIFESPGKADAARESQVANSAVANVKILNGRLVTGGAS